MKIKKVQLSLIVLFALTIASFSFFAMAEEQALTNKNIFLDSDQDGLSDAEEKTYGTNPQVADTDGDGYSDGTEIQSGYDPLKPAPGDKLLPTAPDTRTAEKTTTASSNKPNLTDEVTKKISTLVNAPDSNNQDVTMEQVKTIVDESLSSTVSPEEFPTVDKNEITVKKIAIPTKATPEQITQLKKDAVADYIAGTSYVISSNSPEPLTSAASLTAVSTSLSQELVTGIATQNTTSIKKVLDTEQKVVEQLKSIAVPEELIDLHTEALRIAKYSQTLDKLLTQNSDDPVANIANFSKAASLMDYASTFSNKLTTKLDSYGLTYDDSMKNKLSTYGTQLPSDDLIQTLFQ